MFAFFSSHGGIQIEIFFDVVFLRRIRMDHVEVVISKSFDDEVFGIDFLDDFVGIARRIGRELEFLDDYRLGLALFPRL